MNCIYHISFYFYIISLLSCSQKNNERKDDNTFKTETCIGNIFSETDIENLMTMSPIKGEKVTFLEDKYTLSVNKQDLINLLKSELLVVDYEYVKIINTTVQYITKTDSLILDYIWTKSEEFEYISLFDINKLGERNLTKKVLREMVCPLVESGNFELYNDEKEQITEYFIGGVSCEYGDGTGIFTPQKVLIWMCPPYIID